MKVVTLIAIYCGSVFCSSAQKNLPDSVDVELNLVHKFEKKGLFNKAFERAAEYNLKYKRYPEYSGYFLLRMGSSSCQAKKCSIGILHFRNALKAGIASNDTTLIARSYLGLGAGYQFVHQPDSAFFFYELSEPILIRQNDTFNLYGIQSNRAMLLNNLEDKKKIYKFLILSRESIRDFSGVTANYFNLGMAFYQNNEFDSAYANFFISHSIATENQFREDLLKATRGMTYSLLKLNRKDEAFEYFEQYDSSAFKWAYNADYNDKILELETKFKTAEIERDNALKQTEIETTQSQLTKLYFIIGLVILISSGGYYLLNQRRKRVRAESSQQVKDLLQQQEMKTTYALLEGQDKERKRIASELHDNLGSILVTLNMYADSLTSKSKPEQVLDIAKRISDTSNKANEEVRKISHSLDSGLLNHFGLKAAISQLMEAIELSKKIKIQFNIELEKDLSNELGLQVYRMIQELVNNSLKHSHCSKINLDIQINGEITIIYEDDGIGFDLKKVERGMGLNNIQQRVEKLSGELKIDSTPERGSTFIIEFPTK
ncbi:MAG: sensor histidine kinase [Cyclobacteriaceae bacterium]